MAMDRGLSYIIHTCLCGASLEWRGSITLVCSTVFRIWRYSVLFHLR